MAKLSESVLGAAVKRNGPLRRYPVDRAFRITQCRIPQLLLVLFATAL